MSGSPAFSGQRQQRHRAGQAHGVHDLQVRPDAAQQAHVAALLAGAAVWDSGRQAAATFEPCFKFLTLGPGGKSFTVTSVLSIEK